MRIGRLRIGWVGVGSRRRASSSLPDSLIHFMCTVCGFQNSTPSSQLQREVPSCHSCGSTVRFRSIALHLLNRLGLPERSLAELPVRRDLVGIGLSDWPGYAKVLETKFQYSNTYFHRAPRLDICKPPADLYQSCDFLISSDVFEHVLPPAENAFFGAAQMLKRGGVLVLTVPFVPRARTLEHYPDAVGYEADGNGRVMIETRAGRYAASGPVFHGGPGSTLEMRVFGALDIHDALVSAGFEDIVFHAEANLEAGIIHRDLYSVPITARRG